jgi:SNF2 family DNA or RNA helicase
VGGRCSHTEEDVSYKVQPKRSVKERLKDYMKLPLMGFQRRGVEHIEKCKGRALICDQMGLGKSAQSLAWAAIRPHTRPVVVVCPASIKWQWAGEWKKFSGLDSYICQGMKPRRGVLKAQIVILNYDILAAWLPILLRLQPKILIIDEAHFVKNKGAKRTKACRELAHNTPHVIGLSGTPIEGRPAEFFPILNMVRPDEFPSFWKYAFEFCAPRKNPWGRGYDFSGSSNLDTLHQRLKKIMVRRMKEDVLTQLPPKRRTVVPVKIDNAKEYREAEENFLSWLKEKKGNDALRRAMKAQAVVKMGNLKMLAAEGKLERAIEWINEWLESTDEKLIVFAIHKKILQRLREAFPKGLLIDGSVSNKRKRGQVVSDRQSIVNRFQKDPKRRLLFGQLRAAGIGLNLTAASHVLKLELHWTPGVHDQAEDRCHRIGQKKQVNVYYLVGRGTIEERILSVLESKSKITKRILDGKRGLTMKLLSMYEKEIA